MDARPWSADAGEPMTPTEFRLGAIWSEVLAVGDISAADNFMDLGGDSIAATRCLNRVKASFGIHVPIDLLLGQVVTLRDLASHIDRTMTTR